MGKTHHPNSSPYIRHVRYTTKNTTRGPKVVKRHVQQPHFWTSPSKARSSSHNHQEPSYEDNYDSYNGSNNMGGKVFQNSIVLGTSWVDIEWQSQNDYLRDFLKKRTEYISEILTREACMDENRNCVGCGIREGSWRCRDCIGNGCHCIQCFRDIHRLQPFHRVEHWNGTHFDPAWLCQVGVEIYLGHGGKPCPIGTVQPEDTFEEEDADGSEEEDAGFGVESEWEDEGCSEPPMSGTSSLPELKGRGVTLMIDCSGLHKFRIHPCCCQGALPIDIQCLRMGFFPTSFKNIKTVITFQALEDQRLDNLECKTALLRYWNKLRRKTSVDAWPLLPVRFISLS